MFRPSQNWNPYVIPPTPNISNKDVYSLTCSTGASSSLNPSEFLQWRKIEFPKGNSQGDMLYWDPSLGEGGEWAILEVEAASSEKPKFLSWDGSTWNFVETKTFDVCENGVPVKYEIPAKKL